MAWNLLSPAASVTVIRVLSVCLAAFLVAAPNASWLCRAWCDSHVVSASACHHHESSAPTTRVAASHQCDDAIVADAALPERLDRTLQIAAHPALLIAPAHAASIERVASALEHRPPLPLARSPLISVLRI